MKSEVVRPFLEKALADWANVDEIEADRDGDYGFRRGSAKFYVRLTKDDPPVLRLWAVLLNKVKATPKVFKTVNTINSVLAFGRVYWKDDGIVLGMELATENIDAEQVAWACDVMGILADDLDTKLKDDLGGKTTFPDEPDDEEDAVKV